MTVLALEVPEAKAGEIRGALRKHVGGDRHIVTAHDDILGLLDPLFEKRRRDGALIYIEERDVVVRDLVQKDDELDEIGVGLLPERFLAAAKEIVQ